MDSEGTNAEEELAELIVGQVAPEEQELFGVFSDVYRRDPRRFMAGGAGRDEMLGFGVGEAAALLTPVVLAAVGEVTRYLAELGLAGWLRRKRLDRDALSSEQLARVRQIVLEKCKRAGVAEDRSDLLADAVVGALNAGG